MAAATRAACPWSLQVPFAAALVGSSLPDALRFGSLAATLRLRRLRPFCALTAMFLLNVNRCGSRPGVPGARGGRRAGAGRSVRPGRPRALGTPGVAGKPLLAGSPRTASIPEQVLSSVVLSARKPRSSCWHLPASEPAGPLLLGFGIHFLDLDTKTQNMTFFPPQRNRR